MQDSNDQQGKREQKEKAKLMCTVPQGTKQISINYLECNKQTRDA